MSFPYKIQRNEKSREGRGTGSVKAAFAVLSIAATLGFAGCHDKPAAEDDKSGYVLPDSLKRSLEFDTVRTTRVVNALTLTGMVDFDEDNVIKLFPMISGQVQGIHVMLGDYVHRGQVLASVRSPEMANYSNDIATAKSNLDVAKKTMEATDDMFKSGLASQRDQLAAQEGYNQAMSNYQRSERILNLNGGSLNGDYTVKSPIDGFIVEKSVNNNTMIRTDNNTNLFTISDLKTVWVMANVYESNIPMVKAGDSVSVTTLSYPGKVFYGHVDKIMNVLDPTNKVMKVKIVLSNPGYLLKPQMFATVTVKNAENKHMTSIPAKALIFDHSQYYVLVYKSDKDISIRPIHVMSTVGDIAYISDGVADGDVIIGTQALLIYQELNS